MRCMATGIERVVLFGSRARGDAHAESDYDVAVFLHDMEDRGAEMNRLADLSTASSMRRVSSCTRCPTAPAPTTDARR